MRRERKEILNRIDELNLQMEMDRQLAYGYTASDFGLVDPRDLERQELEEKLASTYGVTLTDYIGAQMMISDMICRKECFGWH